MKITFGKYLEPIFLGDSIKSQSFTEFLEVNSIEYPNPREGELTGLRIHTKCNKYRLFGSLITRIYGTP